MSKNFIIEDFRKAVKKLEEILEMEKTEVVQDSAIKRFEFCFDLAWKSIKYFAKKQGEECFSPRECFKTGFQLKFIDYSNEWLAMIEDRNLTSHTYSLQYADEVYGRLNGHLAKFKELLDHLEKVE